MKKTSRIWATLAAWLATGAAACSNDSSRPVAVDNRPRAIEAISDRSQELWLARRQEALLTAESQVSVLLQARQELQGRRLGIPRDAAICFQARHLMDKQLRVAMQAGGEFAPALDTWHAQARGVETFCAYALTVGAPK